MPPANDLSDKTILVTGATDGLGRALARELAARGATVLIHGRDADRVRATERELAQIAGGARPRSYLADFSSLAEVRAMAEQVLSREQRLDALVNNAGVGATAPGDGERMLSGTGVTTTCLHPATYMPTKIVDSPVSSLEDGVRATFRLAADIALEGVSGSYFNGARESDAVPQAYDPDARRRLAEVSAELVAPHSSSSAASPPPSG